MPEFTGADVPDQWAIYGAAALGHELQGWLVTGVQTLMTRLRHVRSHRRRAIHWESWKTEQTYPRSHRKEFPQ